METFNGILYRFLYPCVVPFIRYKGSVEMHDTINCVFVKVIFLKEAKASIGRVIFVNYFGEQNFKTGG